MKKDIESILFQLNKQSSVSPASFLNEETYYLAIESAFNMVLITDPEGVICYINPAGERITGYSRGEALGKTPRLWGGFMPDEFYRDMWGTVKKGKVYNGEITNRRKNGDQYLARITISPIKKQGDIIGFIGTEEDITLQKQLEKQKEEFISTASHQMRTPLGIMKWNLEFMESHYKELGKNMGVVIENNQLMINTINNLLSVMRISDNKFEPKRETINAAEFVENIKSGLEDRLKAKKLLFTARVDAGIKQVKCDALILKEIILNLLDNAIKYSRDGGEINLTLKRTKKGMKLAVLDHGIGIPDKDKAKITDKYYRGKNAQHISGTGLGLYIINSYLQRMKGTMELKKVKGGGTEVICSLPNG